MGTRPKSGFKQADIVKSIDEIKNEFTNVSISEIRGVINNYINDERKGVKTLISSYQKKYEAYIKEVNRLEKKISQIENKYYNLGAKYVAGVDEVGRIPLAGAVVRIIQNTGCRQNRQPVYLLI